MSYSLNAIHDFEIWLKLWKSLFWNMTESFIEWPEFFVNHSWFWQMTELFIGNSSAEEWLNYTDNHSSEKSWQFRMFINFKSFIIKKKRLNHFNWNFIQGVDLLCQWFFITEVCENLKSEYCNLRWKFLFSGN